MRNRFEIALDARAALSKQLTMADGADVEIDRLVVEVAGGAPTDGLGPVIALTSELPDVGNLAIALTIRRDGKVFFEGESSTSQIHRSLEELVSYLRRHNDFPSGVFLMTGTGIVPPTEFTLEDGDHVEITIEGIGTLENPVVRLKQ